MKVKVTVLVTRYQKCDGDGKVLLKQLVGGSYFPLKCYWTVDVRVYFSHVPLAKKFTFKSIGFFRK